MKLLGRTPGAILCCMTLAAAAFAQAGWQGTYEFGENGGKNAGGTVIFVTHELNVFRTDGRLRATLRSNGYQTSRNLNCTAKIDGEKLLLYFESYGEDNMSEIYDRGDLLLTLERKNLRGKTSILTYWGKITPIMPSHEKSGKVYFKRTVNSPL